MASYLAQQAANQVFGDIQREWSSAVGNINVGGQQETQPTIDWANLNYPPLLRIVHYDPDELPQPVARVVKFINAVFVITCVVQLVNLIDSFILAGGGAGWFRVIYSCLNFMILIPVSGYVFYQGYRALALSSSYTLNKYLLMQGILVLLAVFFCIIPFGAFNGLAAFAVMKKEKYGSLSSGIKGFWVWAVICETCLWFVYAVIGAWDAYRAKTFNPYHSQEARSVGRV